MTIKENLTRYTCDFCKKKLYVKQAMERHEKMCYGNPENQKACSGCKHLEETTMEYQYHGDADDYQGPETRKATAFRCKLLDKLLYPHKVEVKKLNIRYPETFKDQEAMPKTCDKANYESHYDDMPY